MPRHEMPRSLSLLCFVVTSLFAPHCADEPQANGGAPAAEAGDPGVVVSAATWTLDWQTEGVAWDPNGGFSLTTNLGYEVHVDRGHHVLHGVSLARCPEEAAPATGLFGLPISIPTARAHTTDEDPSALELLFVSSLDKPPVAREIGASAFEPARYCSAFFLLARGMPGAVASDGEDLENRSVFFSGSWRRGETQGPLAIDTWWPEGRLLELSEITDPSVFEEAARDQALRFAFVTIRIPLGEAFDDVDFETDGEPVIVDRIVGNLTARAEMVVDLRAP